MPTLMIPVAPGMPKNIATYNYVYLFASIFVCVDWACLFMYITELIY